jgi:hypothetical protein
MVKMQASIDMWCVYKTAMRCWALKPVKTMMAERRKESATLTFRTRGHGCSSLLRGKDNSSESSAESFPNNREFQLKVLSLLRTIDLSLRKRFVLRKLSKNISLHGYTVIPISKKTSEFCLLE